MPRCESPGRPSVFTSVLIGPWRPSIHSPWLTEMPQVIPCPVTTRGSASKCNCPGGTPGRHVAAVGFSLLGGSVAVRAYGRPHMDHDNTASTNQPGWTRPPRPRKGGPRRQRDNRGGRRHLRQHSFIRNHSGGRLRRAGMRRAVRLEEMMTTSVATASELGPARHCGGQPGVAVMTSWTPAGRQREQIPELTNLSPDATGRLFTSNCGRSL